MWEAYTGYDQFRLLDEHQDNSYITLCTHNSTFTCTMVPLDHGSSVPSVVQCQATIG